MTERRRDTDSDGSPQTQTTAYHTIFIDTSLDTHLAMSVSDSDTVTILKEKLVSEHRRCFPEIGEIKIHALKVKRKSYFYHLPDYMLVKSAFQWANEDWFLEVDVSIMKVHNEFQQAKLDVSYQKALVCIEQWPQGHNQQKFLLDDPSKTPYAIYEYGDIPNGYEREVSRDIAMGVGCHADGHSNDFSSGTTEKSALRVQKSDVVYEKNGILETTPGFMDDKSTDDDRKNVECFPPAKKHKSRHNAVVACSASKDNNTFVHASQSETATAVKSTGNKEDKKTKRKQIKGSVRHQDQDAASVLSSKHVVEVKKSSEQNGLIDSSDLRNLSSAAVGSEDNVQREDLSEPSELSQNQMQHGSYKDAGKGSTLPRLSKDVNEPHDLNMDGKNDVSEKAAECHKGGASLKKCDNLPDNHELAAHEANKIGEAGDLSPNPDAEVKLSSLKHVPDQVEGDMSVKNPTLAATFSNVHEAIDDGNGSGSKQKVKKAKKVKKSSTKVLDSINMNQDNNKMNGSSSPALNIVADASLRDEVKSNQGFIPLTQTDQTKQDEGERESGFTMKLSDANVTKDLKTPGTRKKKTARKSARAVPEDAANIEPADNYVSHSTTAPNLHIVEKNEEDKNYLSCAESKETSKRKSSDASARKRAGKPSGDVEMLRPITQTAETEEKGENMDGRMGKDNIEDVPTKEQGNGTEFGHQDEANRAVENAENTNKIVKKKVKKSRSSVENNHENAPINDKKIGEGITSLDDRVDEVDTPYKEQGNKIAGKQLNQANKSLENTEKGERKSRKKTKDRDSDMPIEDHVGDVVAPNDRSGELDTSSKVPESLVHMSPVLDQTNKTQEHSGTTTMKPKKAKGNRSSAAESNSNFPIKNQGVVEDMTASTHELRELNSRSKTTKKMRSDLNQTSVSESKKNAVENNFEGTETEIDTGNLAEVARCEEVNFKQYFVPEQHQSEVVTKQSEETIAEKRVEEGGLPTVGTVPELQQGGSIKTFAGKAKDTTKSSKVSKTKKKPEKHGLTHAPTSLEFDAIEAPQKPVATAISKGSDTNKSVPAKEKAKSLKGASSTSSSESSERTHLKKKDEKFRTPLKKKDVKESGLRRHDMTSKSVSTMPRGGFTNSKKQEKSLLSTPRSIFQDESGESSRDENGLVDSDASTRTPSDNSSSSSGYSSDDSEISKNPSKNGPNGVKRKGGENTSKLEYSMPKQIPMDMIFRSSSRFKKAKLTASQQLDDSEIQPIDFVPDSQAPE